MAVIGGQYVSAVTYSVAPVAGTDDNDLTSTTGNGVTFPAVPGTSGLFADDKPLYTVTLTFNPAGVDSLGSIALNPGKQCRRILSRVLRCLESESTSHSCS